MRLFKFIVPLFAYLLISCGGATTTVAEYSVQLNNPDNSSFDAMGTFPANEVVNLPVLEREDQLFVGWSDDDNIYYDEIKVTNDLTLTAVFEELSEVFTYRKLYADNYFLTGYTGEARYLRLPERIGDAEIVGIDSKTFENSDLIEVYIPRNYSRILDQAFSNSADLEKVSFYGEYSLEKDLVIDKNQYEFILADNTDNCEIVEDNTTSWKFSEGCPIKEVTKKSAPIIINDEEYYTLEVTVDLTYYEDDIASLELGLKVFNNCPSLHTIEFPERFGLLNPYVFQDTPKLSNIRFDDNLYYEVIENVVYRKDEDKLIYYPSGLDNESFTIPDNIVEIHNAAFYGNEYLVTLNLNANLRIIGSSAFYGLLSLEEYNVAEGNEVVYSVDGVLYTESSALFSYPAAKQDASYEVLSSTITIAPGAFWGQRYLENITIPDGLRYIGVNSFAKVEKIKFLDLPATVTLIDSNAFTDSSIETVILRRSGVEESTITKTRLFAAEGLPTFYVPDDSYDLYRYDISWGGMMDFIRPMSEYEEE
jgi:hypothetical protein